MPTYNAAVGNDASATSSTGSLNHAANVVIVLMIGYLGTTSPNAVTVGGVSATLVTGSKKSQGTVVSIESWIIYRGTAANETVSVGFAASTRHAWNAVSYTGANMTYEDVLTGTSTGASPTTSTVTPAAGTTGRMLVCGTSVARSAAATGSITIAAANGETKRDSTRALAGSASVIPISTEFQEIADNTGTHADNTTDTLSSATLDWVTVAFGLQPSTNNTIVPAQMPLVWSGFAPILALALQPAPMSLIWSGFAPVMLAPVVKAPAPMALTWNGFVTIADMGLKPIPMSLVWTGFPPVMLAPVIKAPAPMPLAWSGLTPSLDLGILPSPMPIVWTGYAPILLIPSGTMLVPGTMALTWNGFAPTLDLGIKPGVMALNWTGMQPDLTSD